MKKILFVDRDGTLIREPADQQVDSWRKLELLPGVIPALLSLTAVGYKLVMVTNQDGLGTPSFPTAAFAEAQDLLLQIFASQGLHFEQILVCPHLPADRCLCRKPHLGLVRELLSDPQLDRRLSMVIGDRESDLQLAENMGLRALKIDPSDLKAWATIAAQLCCEPRQASLRRATRETDIKLSLNIDGSGDVKVQTGIGFFDHMLAQLGFHAGWDLSLEVQGDLHIDEHHTVEDTAIALGEALRQAVGDKVGLGRYGFTLPLDEALASATLDLSGRPLLVFNGEFKRAQVGGLPTELVPHFFRSLATAAQITLHLSVSGDDTHHQIEACFKVVARTLRQALQRSAGALPSTKGVL